MEKNLRRFRLRFLTIDKRSSPLFHFGIPALALDREILATFGRASTTDDSSALDCPHSYVSITAFFNPVARKLPRVHRAIYPGTFDPITNGHLDIIQRGCTLFDEIIVAVLINQDKRPLFTVDERVDLLRQVIPWPQVRVDKFDGLLVEYAVKVGAHAIVRGIRAVSDYEYELQMALMNRRLEPRIETVFMMPAETYTYLSSRLVKEVFGLGGSIKGLVPELVEERMRAKVEAE